MRILNGLSADNLVTDLGCPNKFSDVRKTAEKGVYAFKPVLWNKML